MTLTALCNPLYDAWLHLTKGVPDYQRALLPDEYTQRGHLCKRYAWAIPTDEALAAIADYSPIVELGAGTGYWAMLLESLGARVTCFDSHPPNISENRYKHAKEYHVVRRGGPESLVNYTDHALFLCWPPYDEPMAMQALECYHGQTLIYVGEDSGGCTGNEAFHDALTKWTVVQELALPQWNWIHDALWVYRR